MQAESTIKSSITNEVQTFSKNDLPNPTKDINGVHGRLILRLFRAINNKDPKHVLQKLAKVPFSKPQIAIGELAIRAFFSACRSSEYLKFLAVEKKNKILKLKGMSFFRNGIELKHSEPQLNNVSLNFANQTNGTKDDIVTHQGTGDILFCSPQFFARI